MPPSTERSPPPKATLHCPECGHTSHVDGDWAVQDRAGVRTRTCPDCGTTIDTRPSRDVPAAASGGTPAVVSED
jgi:endogenous inhibitor of DNA gyrase (YacG/DUF329 family)